MTSFSALSAAALLALLTAAPALAQQGAAVQTAPSGGHAHDHKHDHNHSHSHSHSHATEAQAEEAVRISKGYFRDDQVALRPLSDWAGEWQSVWPLMEDGTLRPVMEKKAMAGLRSEADWTTYYTTGYRTDVNTISISAGGGFRFEKADGTAVSGQYESDGTEILTYVKGNRGVRFIFRKVSGDEGAPAYVQFSDHRIAPSVSDHFHLYWGDDREALLKEVEHWPTYYPAALTRDQILHEMLGH